MSVCRPVWVGPLAVALGAITLSFPTWLNESPFLFWDSDGYYRAGRSVISNLFEGKTYGAPPDVAVSAAEERAATTASISPNVDLTLWSARSPHYGILVYVGALAAGLWGAVAVQALMSAAVAWRTAEAFAAERSLQAYAAMGAAATLASSLPWFVGFIMPDIWLSLAVLLFAALMFGMLRTSLFDLALLVVLMGAAGAFHRSNLALLAVSMPSAVVLALLFGIEKGRAWKVVGAAFAGLAGALAGGWVFEFAAERRFGQPLRTPIFATARVVADGPGRNYLRSACAVDPTRYALCRHRELPLDNSEAILWSVDPSVGVYTLADYKTRVALSDEQWSFVIATILFDPLGVAVAATSNALDQATRFGLNEFRDHLWAKWSGQPYWGHQAIFGVTPRAAACLEAPNTCTPPSTVAVFNVTQRLAYIGSLVFLVWHTWRLKAWRPEAEPIDRQLAAFTAFLLLASLINAAICGALSTPADRYQARLIWVFPTTAALIGILRWEGLRTTVR
jgi:hypothetical protein